MFSCKVRPAALTVLLALAVGVLCGCGERYRNDAEKKFLKAAKKGDAEAQYSLGACYEFGGAAPKDVDLAKKWYGKAAAAGNDAAKRALETLESKKEENPSSEGGEV